MENTMHFARLAFLEAALLSILREKDNVFDGPDTVCATLTAEGLDIEYFCKGNLVAGEGI